MRGRNWVEASPYAGGLQVDDGLAVYVPASLELDRGADLLDRERRCNGYTDLTLDTLLAMIESGEIAHAQTRTELLAAIDDLLKAGRASGEIRVDVTAEDIAASLIGIFTVAHPPKHEARAGRLLDIVMDGIRRTAGTT